MDKASANVSAAPPLLSELASYSHALRLQDVPGDVRTEACLCILDTIGCIVAGAALPESSLLLRSEARRDPVKEATVLCHGVRLCASAATRVNGYMGDVLELNDLIGGHASIATVTTALAIAEARSATGAELLEAVIAGIEVTARVYAGYYPALKPFTETGMSAVGFPSTIGTAAMVAKLIGLDASQTAHAMANAGALAGWCPAEAVFGDGGTVKPMLFGAWPGTVAILGAQYAQDGLSGPLQLLESRIGFFATAARSHDPERVRDRGTWHLASPRRKIHACCGYIHSAIDAIAALRHAGHDAARAARIRVAMPAYVLPAVSKESAPVSATDALFHAQYCLALAARGADVILPAHSLRYEEHLRDDGLRSLMQRVEVFAEPVFSHYHQCRVELLGADGALLAAQAGSAPRGTASNPLSHDEVRDKFRRLVEGHIEPARLEPYLQRIANLEQEAAVGWLVDCFRL